MEPNAEIDVKKTQELRDIIRKQQEGFYMNRVPDETKRIFKQLAEESFCGDFGLLLKTLVDYYVGDMKYAYLFDKLNMLEHEVYELRHSRGSKHEEKSIRTMDGRIINKKEIKKEENDKREY